MSETSVASVAPDAAFDRLLRWYPRSWRRVHGPALIGTMLDAADAENRTRPTPDERRDIMLNGARERLGVLVPHRVRDLAALLALGTGAGLSIVWMTGQWWPIASWAGVSRPEQLIVQVVPVFALWILAAGAAALRLSWVSRVVTLLTIPAGVWATQVDPVDFLQRPSGLVVVFLAVLAVLAAIGRPVRTAADRRILLIVTGSVAVLGAGWVMLYKPFGEYTLLMPRGSLLDLIQHPAPTVIALVAVVVALAARRRVLAGAVLIAAAPWIAAGAAQAVFILLGQLGAAWVWPWPLLVPFVAVPVIVAVAGFIAAPSSAVRRPAPPVR